MIYLDLLWGFLKVGRSVIGYDVFIKRQEDYHDENSERSIGAIRRLSGYASLLRWDRSFQANSHFRSRENRYPVDLSPE